MDTQIMMDQRCGGLVTEGQLRENMFSKARVKFLRRPGGRDQRRDRRLRHGHEDPHALLPRADQRVARVDEQHHRRLLRLVSVILGQRRRQRGQNRQHPRERNRRRAQGQFSHPGQA